MRQPRDAVLIAVVATIALTLTACGSDSNDASSGTPAVEPCPAALVEVVVSVDQWGDVVESLGGACTEVTTVIQGAGIDPHDYEPTAADIAAFDDSSLVVVNGVDYDRWAADAAAGAASDPVVIDAGEVTGVEEGEDPHLWYSPAFVAKVADAITEQLQELSPEAAEYLDAQAEAWDQSLAPYTALVDELREEHSGAPYAATEGVFTRMAEAIELDEVTPQGYVNASINESDPAPGDVAAFEELLADGKATVLIYNTQTESTVSKQLRRAAESADVPVVEITESVPEDADGFVDSQVTQLVALQQALAG